MDLTVAEMCDLIPVMIKDKKEIGRRIRHIRNDLGLNQTEFGAELGVVASSVSAYEKGETSPSFEMMAKIAKLGNMSIDDLLTGGAESAPPYPDGYESIKAEEEAKGIAAIDPEAALKSLFDSADFFKGLFAKRGRPRNGLITAITGEIQVTEEERRLLRAFQKLDEKRKARLIEDAEDMVLALASKGRDSG